MWSLSLYVITFYTVEMSNKLLKVEVYKEEHWGGRCHSRNMGMGKSVWLNREKGAPSLSSFPCLEVLWLGGGMNLNWILKPCVTGNESIIEGL